MLSVGPRPLVLIPCCVYEILSKTTSTDEETYVIFENHFFPSTSKSNRIITYYSNTNHDEKKWKTGKDGNKVDRIPHTEVVQ